MPLPVVADPSDERGRLRSVQIFEPAIVSSVADRFLRHRLPRSVARKDHGDGIGFDFVWTKNCEHLLILFEHWAQGRIRFFGVRFDIDQESDRGAISINASGVLSNTIAQGIQIKRDQGSIRPDLFEFVSDQQLAIDQINIRLDIAETQIERIPQWPHASS